MWDEVLAGDEGVVPGREDRKTADGLTDLHQVDQHTVIPV